MFVLTKLKELVPVRFKKNMVHNFFLFKQFLGFPANTLAEIKIYKEILKLLFKNEELNVLEWGSGMSSIYYPKFLRAQGQNFQWFSMDNSKKWNEIVLKKVIRSGLDKNIHLFLSPFPPFWERTDLTFDSSNPQKLTKNEQNYISFPKKISQKFDLILIDGRFRRRCLLVAYDLLAPYGIVLLHDAQKSHYHPSLGIYKFGKFFDGGPIYPGSKQISKIWIGSLDRDLSKCII